jgi:hypothetical protein
MVMGPRTAGGVGDSEALQPPFEQPHGAVASLITAITPAVAVAEQQQGDLLVNAIRANALQSREEIMKSHELEGPLGSGTGGDELLQPSGRDGKHHLTTVLTPVNRGCRTVHACRSESMRGTPDKPAVILCPPARS